MTATTTTIDYVRETPEIMKALQAVEDRIAATDLDPNLGHLVRLRASQINQCAFCVNMHTREARRDGETDERLDHVVVWRHTDRFTPREQAALAWTEALTQLPPSSDLADLRDALSDHFSDTEIHSLTALIGMINLWNRLMVAQHA